MDVVFVESRHSNSQVLSVFSYINELWSLASSSRACRERIRPEYCLFLSLNSNTSTYINSVLNGKGETGTWDSSTFCFTVMVAVALPHCGFSGNAVQLGSESNIRVESPRSWGYAQSISPPLEKRVELYWDKNPHRCWMPAICRSLYLRETDHYMFSIKFLRHWFQVRKSSSISAYMHSLLYISPS